MFIKKIDEFFIIANSIIIDFQNLAEFLNGKSDTP